MEKKFLKITKEDFELLEDLSNKSVGGLIKLLGEYVFDGVLKEPKDKFDKVYFYILKERIDERELKREIGRIGGIRSAEVRKQFYEDLAKEREKKDTKMETKMETKTIKVGELPFEAILDFLFEKAPKEANLK